MLRHAPIAESGKTKTWTWYCRKDRGVDVIDQHMSKLSATARARFQRSREQLKALPINYWSKPHPASYVQSDHIYVIRFHDEARTQWRVFGHAEPGAWQFVMTFIGTEKDNVYIPSNAGQRAQSHWEFVSGNFAERACQCYKPPTPPGSSG